MPIGVSLREPARSGIERLLRPHSVAVIGIAKEPGSLGETQVGNFDRFGFAGEIHLVSRNRNHVDGRACVKSVDDLPFGIDAAVLCVPRAGVVESIEACARRGIGSALIFASGFAEQDDAGRRDQVRLSEIAAGTGIAINGPNCLGLTNFINGVPYAFGRAEPPLQSIGPGDTAVAVVTQSGATMVNVARGLAARGLPISLQVSTGNEAALSIEDHLGFVLDDGLTGPVALFAEQIRKPARFLQLVALARERGRHLVLLHPGRSSQARAAAKSHTGAIVGDYDVMRTVLEHAGIVFAESIDELIDIVTVLARHPVPPMGGVAIGSDSGAVKSLSIDDCVALGLDLPEFGPATVAAIHESLPSFATVSNPLDLTAQCIYDGLLYERTARAILADPAVGSYVAIIQPGPNLRWLQENALFDELRASAKPSILALPYGGAQWPDALIARMQSMGVAYTSSSLHALRAMRALTAYGRRLARPAPPLAPEGTARALLGTGPLAEYASKALLRDIGIPVVDGSLARTVDEARRIAASIGYPVVLKAQAAQLMHKSDAGGVAVGIAGAAELNAAWDRVTANVVRAMPGLVLDGCLVESFAAPGLELVIGAKRDPEWGPVLAVGLGGVWIEALADVRLFAAAAGRGEILDGLTRLKGAALLAGARGSEPVDVEAIADVAVRLGALMRAHPEIVEVDINPLVAYARGAGVIALDALIVNASR